MPFLTQEKTNWKYILIVLILAVIVGGGILGYMEYFRKEIVSLTQIPGIKFQEKLIGEKIEKEIVKKPEEVVQQFFNWYLSDWRYQHRVKATEREELTEEYKKQLIKKFETIFTYDPVIFAQDLPDKEIEIGEAKLQNKEASVIVTLKYPIGDRNLLVKLLLIENEWKIDEISPVPSEREIPRG